VAAANDRDRTPETLTNMLEVLQLLTVGYRNRDLGM
jgi:hypothetical protein